MVYTVTSTTAAHTIRGLRTFRGSWLANHDRGNGQPCESDRIASPSKRTISYLRQEGCLRLCVLSCHESGRVLVCFREHPHLPFAVRRQLAEVRKASQDRSGGTRVVEAEKKLIICAVKKPLKLNESQDGQSRVSLLRNHAYLQHAIASLYMALLASNARSQISYFEVDSCWSRGRNTRVDGPWL